VDFTPSKHYMYSVELIRTELQSDQVLDIYYWVQHRCTLGNIKSEITFVRENSEFL